MDSSDLVGAAFLPTDGQANPSDIAQSLAKGARMHGVKIVEDCPVIGVRGRQRPRLRRRHAAGHDPTARSSSTAPASGRGRSAQLAGVSVPLQSVQHQYIVTEPIAGRADEPADAARSRPADLFQGRGRRPGDGRLRAEPDSLGRPTAFRTASSSSSLDDDWDHFEQHHDAGARARAGARDRRHQAADQRAGTLHAGRQLHPRRSAGSARTSSSAPASTPSASLGRRRRPGARRVDRRAAKPPIDLWPVDIRRFGRAPPRPRLGARRARSRPTASTTRWPSRSRSIAAAGRARLAALRAAEGAGRRASARSSAGSGRTGSRRAGVEPQRRLHLSAGRTGSARSATSTRPAASASRCSTRPRFAKFELSGTDAERRCQWICANDVGKPAGPPDLHADAEHARRHRVRPHRRAAGRGPLLHRHRHRLPHPRFRLDRRNIPADCDAHADRRHVGLCACCR